MRAPSVQPTTDDFLQSIPRAQLPGQPLSQGKLTNDNSPMPFTTASLQTNYGDITIQFFPEPVKTVENFVRLAQNGFYDGVKFHRVIKGFMIQTGDPLSRDDDWSNDGRGGPGYTFADEINEHKLVTGSVAMANAGPNTNGSQFFIVTAEATPWLDGKHTNFGTVIAGLDVVRKIESVAVNENDHPLEDIVINRIILK
jgi:cyclophilin family peptidyl-prolyl cis-trans isomerase